MRVVIVGGGIAGLFSAILMRSRFPECEIVILEKSSRLGGRIFTKKYPDGSSFEAGAGRFGMKHKALMALFKRYGLDKDIIPINNEIHTQSGPLLSPKTIIHNGTDIDFRTKSLEDILNMLENDPNITPTMLMENTIETLTRKVYGNNATRKIIHGFEYDSEIQVNRAQTGLRAILDTFRGEFGVLKGGLSRLVREMEREITGSGGRIMLGSECVGLEIQDDDTYKVKWGSGSGSGTEIADKLFICTTRKPACSLVSDLIGEEDAEKLYGNDVIQETPLMRVYARFPINWIDHKIVTRKGIRYVIPVSSDPPIVMISYIDGPIASLWSRVRDQVGDRECANEIMRQLRTLLPRKKIPDPIWVSFEEWGVGASFWKPSEYDITLPEEQNKRQNPIKNVYVCAEFLSLYHQAWIEGALERCLRVARTIKG
jgi:hypothetical protein